MAIPAGVKMHSGVFAASPQAAADLVVRFLNGELNLRETEIVDVDEELYRAGILQTKLYALAKTPYLPVLVAERKRIYSSVQEDEFKDQIALFASEFMQRRLSIYNRSRNHDQPDSRYPWSGEDISWE